MPTWLWLLVLIVPLVLLERWIHRHLQGFWLLLLRDPDMALMVYSLIMLPGVLLHEASHYLVALVLGVRTGRFSVVPKRLPNGTLRLGYVETEHVDVFREALIGLAPLISGLAAIVVVGYARLGVTPVGAAAANGDLTGTLRGLQTMTDRPDFWLWVYLTFTVANSMLPSASDRRAWLPAIVAFGLLAALALSAGFGPIMFERISVALEAGARALAAAFTVTVGLNLFFVPLIWLSERVMMRVTGLRVQY